MSLNEANLIGHLGQDPDIRRTQDGKPVCNLSIATSDHWKDKNTGEKKSRTNWHRIVIFNEGLCNIAENYLKKGSQVFIKGAIKTRKWQDQNGQDRYTTEIVLQGFGCTLKMLGKNTSGPSQNTDPDAYDGESQPGSNMSDMDDDIPF
ncbi:MAG: single-stranded DNA-binding protein [Cohaesibacter sp.]|nr:single-stranded DNA-binding protein [Cohaesibacter sp.]